MKSLGFDFESHAPFDPAAMTVAPSIYPQSRETSALAAVQIQPERCTQNIQLLALLKQAGEVGLSDFEIREMTGWLRQTICLRRFDCRSQLEPAATRFQRTFMKNKKFRVLSYQRWRIKQEA